MRQANQFSGFSVVYQEGRKHRYPYNKSMDPPVKIRVDPYIYGSTRIFTGPSVLYWSTLNNTGRPVFYGSSCTYGSGRPVKIRVDSYFKNTGRPVKYVFYGSSCTYESGRPVKIRVDSYFKNTDRPVKYGSMCNLPVDPYFP